ncbi:MaoC/PaaZ C-terminal domain-containing protein [Terracoccus sp. 273MFTsu3.1]|uniref:MaoC/PaaZ C-terminal domain-containing protein n=1 Tax=Terracoccus sp. 273MFTsu3.1 TaxID=1172188 RepID=UPI00036C997C|nr:MaoC/PaaZ C-terminal domain-containing protein [Terracoccus sp. 273MFTsu3.1]
MTKEITLDAAPDLRRIYATAALRRGSSSDTLPDVRWSRAGIRVDVDELVDYAHVCRFPVSGTLPPTYPHLVAFPLQMAVMSGDRFPLPLLGAVHVENRIEALRPVGVDEPLDVSVWAQDLRPHRRGRQVDLVSEVGVRGEVVWRGVSTYLSRGAEHPDADPSEPPSTAPLAAVTTGPLWRLGEGTGRAYAAVSGDWNPIHVHALTARPLGFPSAIAHGMYSYARVLAALGPRLPEAGLTSRVWFRKPVRLPSSVRLRTAFEASRTLSVLEHAKGEIEHAVVENTW